MRSWRRLVVAGLLSVVAALAAGCAEGEGATDAPTGRGPSETPAGTPGRTSPATPAPEETGSGGPPPVDPGQPLASWTGAFDVTLDGGWRVRDCEGDRLDLCVHGPDGLAGDVELLGPYLLGKGEDGEEAPAVAEAWGERFVAEFSADRAAGCPAFAFEADPVRAATVGGMPGARAAFTLTDDGGRVVERVVNHYVVHEGAMWIVNTDAYAAEGGCLGPTETDLSFTPEGLAAFEGQLDGLVAGTPLPAGVAPEPAATDG